MRRALRTELWKAFHNPMLRLAMAGGAFIILASVWDSARLMAEWAETAKTDLSTEGYSLFALAVLILCVIAGTVRFRHTDILGLEEGTYADRDKRRNKDHQGRAHFRPCDPEL